VEDLNRFYQEEPALWEGDYDYEGFHWVDCTDNEQSVLSFLRQTPDGSRRVMVIMNLTPELRHGYRIGLPLEGAWQEVVNSDSERYAGGNQGNLGGVETQPIPQHQQPFSAEFVLPPLSILAFRLVQ
jgi:1,4-alpha-glucan branching enzyme